MAPTLLPTAHPQAVRILLFFEEQQHPAAAVCLNHKKVSLDGSCEVWIRLPVFHHLQEEVSNLGRFPEAWYSYLRRDPGPQGDESECDSYVLRRPFRLWR